MIRRVWGSRNFANCISLLALFVALGGTTLGSSPGPGGGGINSVSGQTKLPKPTDAFVLELLKKFEKPGLHITAAMIQNGSLTGEDLRPKSIGGSLLKPKSIGNGLMKPNSITGETIKDNSISSQELLEQAITADKIKENAITAAQIQDDTITEAKIKPNTITDEAIAPKALTNSSIQASTLTGVEKCSGNLKGPFGDVCTTDLQAAGTWDHAELACDAMGLRLPTITEALRALSTFSDAQEIWTDEVYGANGESRVAMQRIQGDGVTLNGHPPADNVQFRCVTKSSSTT